jgi:ABC-type glycerol-3-phosphate transport system permease component
MNTPAVAAPPVTDTQGMTYLDTRTRRVMTVYLPLAGFLFVLLFPFYWMAITAFKPNAELITREGNPFLGEEPDARAREEAAVRHGVSGLALEHDARRGGWPRSSRSCAACLPRTRSSACASGARATSA